MSTDRIKSSLPSQSADEKRSFLEGLILSSPPGEIKEVYNDLKAILGDDEILASASEDVFRNYNCNNMVVAKLPSIEKPFVLSWCGLLPEGRIFDPRSHKSFKFDNLTMSALDFEDYTHSWKLESLRVEFEVQLDSYVNMKYPNAVASVYAHDGLIHMFIVNNRYAPNKFINGNWCSSWVYDPNSGELKGTLKIRVHYYEDGNVQLKVLNAIEKNIFPDRTDPYKCAGTVLKAVCDGEDSFQRAAKNKFDYLNDRGFRNLRKLLPITKSKINWDAIDAYSLMGVIGEK